MSSTAENRFMCTSCGEIHTVPAKVCEKCKQIFSLVRIPDSLVIEKKRNVASEILKRKAKGKIIPGFAFLGKVPNNLRMIVHGPPGSGKSYFCFGLADAIANFSRRETIYVTSEEELDCLDFQNKLIYCETSDKLRFESIQNKKQFYQLLNERGKKVNIILDSVSDLGLTPKEVKYLRSQIKGIFVFILHVNKKGQHSGSTKYIHDGQVQIEVKKGVAITRKNRFGKSDQKYKIFEEKQNEGEQ